MIQIDQTKTFNSLSNLQQRMILKRCNRLQIEEQIVIANNIGIDKQKSQTPLQGSWQKIVEEVIKGII